MSESSRREGAAEGFPDEGLYHRGDFACRDKTDNCNSTVACSVIFIASQRPPALHNRRRGLSHEKYRGKTLLGLIAASLAGSVLLYGQARDTGSVFGNVTDAQAATVPGAVVKLTSIATGAVRQTDSDSNGGFVFTLLPVGSYNLSVEHPGFRKSERRGILVQANENIRVDTGLEVGNVQEAVTVEAQVANVETRSATLNHTVDSKRIVELPLNGRNPADLVLLAAGVASGATNNSGDVGSSSWRPKGQKEITVNGSRNNNLRYTLDGGTNMDDLMNENMDFPFPDAVQEFSAQTSNMGVEHGGLSGGALNVVTKSGTNRVHGDVFWFVRNTQLNATNFFSRQQDQLKRNQFGFTLGGPFIRNKLFGFAGYQKLTIRQAPGDLRDQSLTAAERRGDFSSNPIPLYDPLRPGVRFPNNMIPVSRFSPAAVKLLSYSPLPDADGFVRYSISQPENGLQGIGKLDYVASPKHNFVFRVFESDSNQPFHSPPDNIHAARYGGYQDGRSATLGHTFILNTNTVVHTQVTGAHQLANIATDFPLTTADLGVKLTPMGNHIDITMTQSGVSFNRPLHAIRFGRGSIELQHDWNMSKGNHSLVWGMSLVRKRFNNNTLFHSSGQFQFDGHVTGFGDSERLRPGRLPAWRLFLLHAEQRRVRAAARHPDRLVFRRHLEGRPRLDAQLRNPLRALRPLRRPARPQPDLRFGSQQGGHPFHDFQERPARPLLSRRHQAARGTAAETRSARS